MGEEESLALRGWRQGSILPLAAAIELNLVSVEEAEAHCFVVVTHDCDIANALHERDIEVIRGNILREVDGNLTGGKNSRKLHLRWMHRGIARNIELHATAKQRLHKVDLGTADPDTDYTFASKDLQTLRFWLGARYNRAAFPDEFNKRLANSKVGEDINKILKPLGDLITCVYVDIDTQDELPTGAPTPAYRTSLILAFQPGDEPLDSAEKAEAAAERVANAFANRCFDKKAEQWRWLELKDCVALSEDDLTVTQAKKLLQLPLEYLSLRSDPQGATPFGVRNK